MRRPECMEQKFGQTQMTAVWKECTRMENAGKRKWVCSLFFVFLLLMGISFTALAAPQAGLNKTKLTMIKGTAGAVGTVWRHFRKNYMEELKKVSCNGQCDGPSESKEKRNGNGHGTCRW